MLELEKHITQFYDLWFIRNIEAGMFMSEKEMHLSDTRSEKYAKGYQRYLEHMKNKNGLDGGPSPAIICDYEYDPNQWEVW